MQYAAYVVENVPDLQRYMRKIGRFSSSIT